MEIMHIKWIVCICALQIHFICIHKMKSFPFLPRRSFKFLSRVPTGDGKENSKWIILKIGFRLGKIGRNIAKWILERQTHLVKRIVVSIFNLVVAWDGRKMYEFRIIIFSQLREPNCQNNSWKMKKKLTFCSTRKLLFFWCHYKWFSSSIRISSQCHVSHSTAAICFESK